MLAKHLARSVRGVDWSLWDGSNDGDETAFSSGAVNYVSACALDSETVFVAYRDAADSSIGKACLLSISGKTVSCSTPVSFFGSAVAYVSVEKLASDRVFIAFEYTGLSQGYAVIAKIIDGEIYFGPLYIFETNVTSDVHSCVVNNDKILVTAIVSSSEVYGYIIVVDGVEMSSISPRTDISSGNAEYPSVCALDTDKAVVAYKLTSDTKGYARVLDVSGSTITARAAAEFEAGETIRTSVEKLSSSVAVVAYTDVTNSNYGTACALGISGTTVTPGTPVVVFNAGVCRSYGDALARIDSTTMMICVRDDGNGSKGSGCFLSISGTAITAGTPALFTAEVLSGGSLVYLKQRYLCCCYEGSTKGYALILDGAA
jgi:hypothetical protein